MSDVINTPKNAKKESTLDAGELAKLKGQLRAQAERTVLQKHQDEYHAEAERLFAEHGLEFTRRLTAEEKAEKEIQELLKKHPQLAKKYPVALQGHGAVKEVDAFDAPEESYEDDGPAVLEDDEGPF